jgi:dipeptidyl aminopeptidase/acylaminoacyl peptidase
MKKITLFLLLLQTGLLMAQPVTTKKVMDHGIYKIWKKISQERISNDGQWVAYTLSPNTEGDALLHLWNASTGVTQIFERGTEGVFTEDIGFFIFKIKQPLDSLKAKRRKKVKEEDLPKDSLGIYNLKQGTLAKVANVKSFAVPQKWSGYIAYQLEIEKPETPKKDVPKDSTDTKSKVKPKAESKDNGSKVILQDLATGQKDTFPYTVEYIFSKKGKRLLVADTGKDSIIVSGVHLFDCDKKFKKTILNQKGKYKQIALDDAGTQAAFIADFDTTKERVRPYRLYFYTDKTNMAKEIAKSKADFGTMTNYLVSDNAKPIFSEDGSKLYYGIAPQPILNDTTLLPEEIVSVEVWAHTDTRLHTQQKVQLEQDKKKYYTVAYHTAQGSSIPLTNPDIEDITLAERRNADFAITYTDEPYQRASTWEGYSARDYYLTDIKTGNKTLFATKVRGNAQISPTGKYIYWFNALDSMWHIYDIATKTATTITDNKTVPYYEEENDVPDNPSSYSIAGWLRDDKYILINDRFDIWKIHPLSKEKPLRLTDGRKNQISYRYIKLDEEEYNIEPTATLLLHTTNEDTKEHGYAYLNLNNNTITPITDDKYAYSRRPLKAKNNNAIVFTKQDFKTFPNLLYTNDFKKIQQISNANPQQTEYYWGDIELVEWTALDGQKLKGMLVKPEGFDPTKKYPMIVNFYEKSSDGLYNYHTLEPLRSQINYSFYANRGYLIFNPDIPYRIGYPGESCLNAVISGVTHLMNKGFVDPKRIGLQGHSWGGYQAAYLVTKTDIFRCAEAGAPVVNMVSAYGGIRWESGVMRQFQYEHTQSRIGGSLWQYPLRFLENSPIFSIDKINTPVLILHNDKDGAVPWYQGIEFFGAMRRLNKPTWLLNYNEEPHWPVKLQNRIDFQTRMQQFFDHYLMDAPMPQWMQRGVPAMEKGIKQGLGVMREIKKG